MKFLLYAPQHGRDLSDELGKSDYSYWFVLRYFEPMLARLGEVEILPDLSPRSLARPGTLLLFMPPHRIPLAAAARGIPVFAWEYSTIPTEGWADEERNDWRVVLSRARGAITHSEFAADAVRAALGPDYPVAALPAPVWDRFAPLADRSRTGSWALEFTGSVIDSWSVGLDRSFGTALPDVSPRRHRLEFSGVTFTTVVNPNDGRKVWDDTATAFVWAHRDDRDATLIMKLVHFDAVTACETVWALIRRLGPFACRIVVIHAYLDGAEFEQLVTQTSYVVNTSRGEGQCLPLMEFMSAGVPAIAPDHTAMAQYVTPADAFPVASTTYWTHWPHDPRRFLRCFTFPSDWESARAAFVAGAERFRDDPAAYAAMRTAATQTLRGFCSQEVVAGGMREFLALPGMLDDID